MGVAVWLYRCSVREAGAGGKILGNG